MDGCLARAALRAVIKDKLAPPAAKAQAARTLAEMSGVLGRHQDKPNKMDTAPLSGLSQAELKAELRRLQGLGD